MIKLINNKFLSTISLAALCGLGSLGFSVCGSVHAQEKAQVRSSVKTAASGWENASTLKQSEVRTPVRTAIAIQPIATQPNSVGTALHSEQTARFRNRPNPIRLVRTQEEEDEFGTFDEDFTVPDFDFDLDAPPKTFEDPEEGDEGLGLDFPLQDDEGLGDDVIITAPEAPSGWEPGLGEETEGGIFGDDDTAYLDEHGNEIIPETTTQEPENEEPLLPPITSGGGPTVIPPELLRELEANHNRGQEDHAELAEERRKIEEQLKEMQNERPRLPPSGTLSNQGVWPSVRPGTQGRDPVQRPPVKSPTDTTPIKPTPVPPTPVPPTPVPPTPVQPTPEQDHGKAPTPSAFFPKPRASKECTIGPPMTFMDQYGWHPEVAPFADFFVEDPCAPMFGLGISHGKDIFGYETNYRLTERPYGWLFDNMQVFVGGSGFGVRHGEIDEKSFGIFEGINWSGSISPRLGLSAQFGVRAVQRTIDGSHPAFGEKDWESGGKGQVFITAGFFKRAQSMPFQVGLVYDWMSDTKYKNRDGGKALNVGQIRTEFSYASACGWTFGFRGAFSGADDDPLNDTLYQVKTTNYFLGFVEKDIWCGSLLSFQAGGTKEGNAILGLCYDQPLYDKFSIKTEFNYMLEKENSSTLGPKDRDGWEAMITFTFHPHGGAFNRSRNPLRAMFDVASNGTMFLSHK